jgi:hypothetical protein
MSSDPTPSLLDRPDAAVEIGFLVMYTANLEAWLIPILAELLKNDEAAMSIVRNVDNLSAKLGIVFETAEQMPPSPLVDAIRAHKEPVMRAIAHRNALAHSQYVWSPSNELSLLAAATTNRRGEARATPFDADATRAHTENLRAAVRAILKESAEQMIVAVADPQARASRGKQPQAIPRLERLHPGHKD